MNNIFFIYILYFFLNCKDTINNDKYLALVIFMYKWLRWYAYANYLSKLQLQLVFGYDVTELIFNNFSPKQFLA
ncbi:MAG: hypothetical protein AUK44_10150 [Porphyromonadaceae bacterium CG2_30_38_12]|nr:MAG: hypothetical protein AUK44_10150 [Porphyromonadaceae bacterium CG2_30_38_12]